MTDSVLHFRFDLFWTWRHLLSPLIAHLLLLPLAWWITPSVPGPHRTNHDFKKRKIYSAPWQRGSLWKNIKVKLCFSFHKVFNTPIARGSYYVRCLNIQCTYMYVFMCFGFVSNTRQMSLSGFKGAGDRCFPGISKQTFCWRFALDHFEDIIRFQHMSVVINCKKNIIKGNMFEFI